MKYIFITLALFLMSCNGVTITTDNSDYLDKLNKMKSPVIVTGISASYGVVMVRDSSNNVLTIGGGTSIGKVLLTKKVGDTIR